MLFGSGTHTNLNKDEYFIPLAVGGCDPFISPTCPPTTHSHIYMRMDNIVNSSSSFMPCYVFSFLLTSSPLSHSPLPSIFIHPSILSSASPISPSLSPSLAAILDDQSVCGRGERLALALARENINSVMEGPARARVEVDIYELQKDSQYDTTDTSEWCENDHCGRITFQQTLLSTGT